MRYFLFPELESIHADNCGYAVLPPGWTHPRRTLGSSVLIVGERGHAPIFTMGEEIDILPGMVTLLPSGAMHCGGEPLTESASYFWFHFTSAPTPEEISTEAVIELAEAFSHSATPSRPLDTAALLPLSFSLDNPVPVYEAFHDLLFEQEAPSYTRAKFQGLFRLLLIGLTENVIAANRNDRRLASKSSSAYVLISYLAEHMTNPNLSVKMASGALGLNPDYVGRRFRETMNLSIGQYILKKRTELAIRYLQETDNTVERIAEICGFSSTRHFLRQFKKERGLTPTDVRKRHRTMHVNAL